MGLRNGTGGSGRGLGRIGVGVNEETEWKKDREFV